MKAGSILGFGVDACVFYEALQCTDESLNPTKDQVSKLLPVKQAKNEYKVEKEIRDRIQSLNDFSSSYASRHVIVSTSLCTPKIKPSDLTPIDLIPKCRVLNATIQNLCADCVAKKDISESLTAQLSDYFLALQSPKYLTTLWAFMVNKAKLNTVQEARFQKAPHAWVEVVIFDSMRTCLVINPRDSASCFLHQDLHSNNVAVTSQFRGALADFGRSMFVRKEKPLEFVKELQKAAFQNGVLRSEMNTLAIYNDVNKQTQFVNPWVYILQSVICLLLRNAEYFLKSDYKYWSHPKTTIMKEQDVLQRAAFVDSKSEESLVTWRDFIWNHVLPFVDFFGIQNNVSALAKKDYSLPVFWSPSLKNLFQEFNLGTLSYKTALETITNAQARALGRAQALSGEAADSSDFVPGSDSERLFHMVQKNNLKQ